MLVHRNTPCDTCITDSDHCAACKPNIYIRKAELKYCPDTKPQEQLANCLQQHTCLETQLLRNGYRKENLQTLPILIGTSGTIYKSHTLSNMEALGISPYHAKKCALKMHLAAINFLHSIIQTRHRLEYFPNGQQENNVQRQPKRHRPP
jgi:hypothetical protein